MDVASASSVVSRSSRAYALGRAAAGVVFFAGFTALGAQVEVRLPFTPVPLTLQTLAVLLAGYFLGARRALASQAAYLAAGAAGLPVFAGGAGGLGHLLGPTGGYLFAMPLAAFVVGAIAARRPAGRVSLVRVAAGFAGSLTVHMGGALGLAVWLWATDGDSARLASLSVLPFVVADLVKVGIAAGLDVALRRIPRIAPRRNPR